MREPEAEEGREKAGIADKYEVMKYEVWKEEEDLVSNALKTDDRQC